jgi:hypothetical protein
MKMRKIMAAGIAATLAVSSFAAVASAEIVREFDMKYSSGAWVYDAQVAGEKSETVGDNFKFVKPADGKLPDRYIVTGAPDLAGGADMTKGDTNRDGVINYEDFDAFIPLRVYSPNNAISIDTMGDLTIIVEGKRYDNGNLVAEKQYVKLQKVKSVKQSGAINTINAQANYVLPIYVGTAPFAGDGYAFIPERFSQIDSIKVSTSSLRSITFFGMDETDYRVIYELVNAGAAPKIAEDADGSAYNIQKKDAQNWWDSEGDWTWQWSQCAPWGLGNDAKLIVELAAASPLAGQICYNVTKTLGASASALELEGDPIAFVGNAAAGDNVELGDWLIKEINTLLQGKLTATWKARATGTIYDNVAWMPITTLIDDGIIMRNEVKLLSSTDDYNSQNIWSDGDTDTNQTYDINDVYNYNQGTNPQGFAGLASQVADFFNKQLNGTITFHFTAKSNDNTGLAWNNGGIPSTEVGLKNFLDAAKAKDFALWINYATSTGSLQADAVLDPYSSTVTFDISAILDALNGNTIGTVHDVYYALVHGASYNGGVEGLYVDTVTLAYNEAAAADAATDETDTDADVKEEVKEEPKADDKADEIEIPDDTEEPDDEDNTVVIDEPDDSTTVIDNTAADNTVVVNPGTNVAPAADENPHTGVALAVVPAALAAAAMIISKKRK